MVGNIVRRLAAYLVVALSLVILAGCGGSPAQSGAKTQQPIKLVDSQWQSLWINNAIAKFIIENGYDQKVEIVEMTTPIMQQSIVKGDADVIMEMWTGNVTDWYNEVMAEKKLLDLGPVMDSAAQGWYVPAYVVKGDEERGIKPVAPDLKSVADLKRYASVFADPENPEKGLMLNCITGWQCAKINRIKLQAYGLADLYNVQEPGAAAALDASIAGQYKKGKPFLTYYWEPTWLMGSLDMIRLEEPPFTQECAAETEKALDEKVALQDVTEAAGCAYEDAKVVIMANPSLKERAPEVVAFLEKMTLKTADLNKASAYMEENKAEADQAAIWYFERYPESWRSWLPDDVAKKVEKALKDAGAKL